MNALTEFGRQIQSLIASMTPQSRVMAGLMLGTILVSLAWIFSSQGSTQHEYLFGGKSYSDAELELFEATFGEAELREYDRVGKRIRVPKGQKDLYLKALSTASALPKEWGGHLNEILNGNNLFESNSMVQIRHETASERELAGIIRRMPGIDFATVDHDEHRTGFARSSEQVCSITVQGRSNVRIPATTLSAIAKTAEHTFAGLRSDRITVTDLGSGQIHRTSGDPNSSQENPYLKAQLEFEQSYYEKLASVLQNTYGEFQLGVNVKLDPTLIEESEMLKYDPTAVMLQSSESRRDLDSTKGTPGGVPGAASNGVSNQPQSISNTANNQSSKTKESKANERRVAGHEATITKKAPLLPESVTVSVGIPDSYYDKIWGVRFLRDNPDSDVAKLPRPTTQELIVLKTEVEDSVRAAVEGIPVGLRQGDEGKTLVKIYSYTDLPFAEIPEISLAENALAWFSESWTTVGMMLIVLVSLGMAFSWLKSQSPDPQAEKEFANGFGLEIPSSLHDELDLADEDGNRLAADGSVLPGGRRKPTLEVSGEEIKEDLSTLIKENPDAAVNLLKTWIGEAA